MKRKDIQPIIERYYQEETVCHDGDIEKVEKYIDQQQADLLEAYKAIVDNWNEFQLLDKCVFCKEKGDSKTFKHHEDCIVLKAEKYIKELLC